MGNDAKDSNRGASSGDELFFLHVSLIPKLYVYYYFIFSLSACIKNIHCTLFLLAKWQITVSLLFKYLYSNNRNVLKLLNFLGGR